MPFTKVHMHDSQTLLRSIAPRSLTLCQRTKRPASATASSGSTCDGVGDKLRTTLLAMRHLEGAVQVFAGVGRGDADAGAGGEQVRGGEADDDCRDAALQGQPRE